MRSTSSPRAVSMRIGVSCEAPSVRRTSNPPTLGSITSRIRMSNSLVRSWASASPPSCTLFTSKCSAFRYSVSIWHSSRSSSTSSTRASRGVGGSVRRLVERACHMWIPCDCRSFRAIPPFVNELTILCMTFTQHCVNSASTRGRLHRRLPSPQRRGEAASMVTYESCFLP